MSAPPSPATSQTSPPAPTSPSSNTPSPSDLATMQRHLSHSTAEYVHAARRMMYLTKAVDLTLESLYKGPALERAIWRYEALWFPILAALADNSPRPRNKHWVNPSFGVKVGEIAAKNFAKGGLQLGTADLVPPLDIAWVWHVHRLQPNAYAEDLGRFGVDEATKDYMRTACGTTIQTAFMFSDGEDTQSKLTRRLWGIIYPYENFMPKYLLSCSYEEEEIRKKKEINIYTNEIARAAFRSLLTYDLVRAADLQKAFLYQIVEEEEGPDGSDTFETTQYLDRAFTRYLQFLLLHDKAPDVLLVPMMDINIMWHMHLSATVEYARDCEVLVGRLIKHDSIAVDDIRIKSIEEMEAENDENGQNPAEANNLEENEIAYILEKRRRGVSVKDTKNLWEVTYGAKPRYDLPDTRYKGQPPGERGGFKEMFDKMNGSSKDISWPEILLRMMLAVVMFTAGVALLLWAFAKTLMKDGIYLLGLPAGIFVMAFGLYIFLAIPISRPLSSTSRYWLERSYKHTHNPLPPYLISSSKKLQ